MKTFTFALLAAGLALTGAACTTDPDPLPTGSDQFPTTTTDGVEEGAAAPTSPPTTSPPAPAASTCDVTREALLTGTQAEIDASMGALVADKTADATAREYADYYLNRDKNEPSLREMDVSLIRMVCS